MMEKKGEACCLHWYDMVGLSSRVMMHCRYGYLVPSNMFASVVLVAIWQIYAADKARDEEMAQEALTLQKEIEMGIDSCAVHVILRVLELAHVYETDGYGNDVWMGDANVPESVVYAMACLV
ncbi:MAG: glycoside hydrolase family 125 protein [Lachnospiraceae bacterium]